MIKNDSEKESIDKKLLTSNMLWRFADKWGSQFVSFVIGIVISRILEPEAYGIVAIVNSLINIFSVFADCGLGDSLIQKKDADDLDYSTALFANIFLCAFVYAVIFVCAPFMARLYDNSLLIPLIRVSSITVLISSYKNIQHAFVAKNMIFKKYFFASLLGTIGSGIIGIIMAVNGFGVWSLIVSNIFDTLVDTIFCAFTVSWRPKLIFSIDRLKKLFGFGSKLLIVSLFGRIYNKIYQLVTGIFYSDSDLAFFDKGDTLTNKITNNIDYTISSVLFPAMSNVQDNEKELKKLTKTMLQVNTYVVFPLVIGLAVVAKPVVSTLYTDKWLNAVPYIQLFCVIRMFLPINTINSNVIKSLGKSNTYLKQQICSRCVSILALIITVKMGTIQMTIGFLISTFLSTLIVMLPNRKYISYGVLEQFKDMSNTFIISIFMGSIVYLISLLRLNILLQLIIQISVGIIIYIFLSFVSRNEAFLFLLRLIRSYTSK